jgi:hypothetical protein
MQADLFNEDLEGVSDAVRQGIAIQRAAAKAKRTGGELRMSEPLENPRFRVLNLGGGTQSCALALMSARGDLEPLDFAIFADTGWEKARTYRYVDWLETVVPFPILRVKRAGLNLGEYLIEGTTLPQKGRQHAPFYLDEPFGMMSKQCSKEFKTRVIHAALRQLLGLERGERGPAAPVIEQWLGMTTDELLRVSVSEKRYLHHRYPLIEKRMTKRDVFAWYDLRQLKRPPKSSCIFCPLQRPDQFREIQEDGEDWQRLIDFDRAIRPGYAGMEGSAYLLRQCKPIDQADLRNAADRGQGSFLDDDCGDAACGV